MSAYDLLNPAWTALTNNISDTLTNGNIIHVPNMTLYQLCAKTFSTNEEAVIDNL